MTFSQWVENDLPLIPSLDEVIHLGKITNRQLVTEPLVAWAADIWRERFADLPCVAVHSDVNCANRIVLRHLNAEKQIGKNTRFLGFTALPCPLILPISGFDEQYRQGQRTTYSVGAYLFNLEYEGHPFPVIFLSTLAQDGDGSTSTSPVALCPPDYLTGLGRFERYAQRTANVIGGQDAIQVIGGNQRLFKAKVEWNSVILDDALKNRIRDDIDSFFTVGINMYRELNLVPFRKLLFVGPPGTGKSTLCAALARHAIQQKRAVVYVSDSDDKKTGFKLIRRALDTVEESRYPVVLIIEELDAYLIKEEKAQILNVLDGLEAPNNPRGVLLIATTNYPEAIDERIAKRPGRIDQIFVIPPIEDESQADRMLRLYMGSNYREEFAGLAGKLIGKTGAFVREIAFHARMTAVSAGVTTITLEMMQAAIHQLHGQLTTLADLQTKQKNLGFRSQAS